MPEPMSIGAAPSIWILSMPKPREANLGSRKLPFFTVIPGVRFMASDRLVMRRSSMACWLITETDCGVSLMLVGVFEPTLVRPVVYEPEFSVASPMPWPWMVIALSSSAPSVLACRTSK